MRRSARHPRAWHIGAIALALAGLSACSPDLDHPAQSVEVVHTFGEAGIHPGQFTFPRCIESDARGVWLIDKSANIQRLNPDTGASEVFFQMPQWRDGKPCGMTIAPGPDPAKASAAWRSDLLRPGAPILYIPDTHYYRVLAFAIDDTALAARDSATARPPQLMSLGSYGQGPGQFVYTTDIAVLPDEQGHAKRLYVSEYGGNDRISVFDAASLEFLFSFGALGESASPDSIEFSRPQSIAIDAARQRLVVNDACNHRVGVFTLDGGLVRWIDAPAPGERFIYPYGLVILDDGTALITEVGAGRMTRLDLDRGVAIASWGSTGRTPGHLAQPWGLTIRDGLVWVLDSGNDRVQAWRLDTPLRDLARSERPAP